MHVEACCTIRLVATSHETEIGIAFPHMQIAVENRFPEGINDLMSLKYESATNSQRLTLYGQQRIYISSIGFN